MLRASEPREGGRGRKRRKGKKGQAETTARSTTPRVILNWSPARDSALLRPVDRLNSVAVIPGPGRGGKKKGREEKEKKRRRRNTAATSVR